MPQFIIKIVKGPSKFDLMVALFDDFDADNPRKTVDFELEDLNPEAEFNGKFSCEVWEVGSANSEKQNRNICLGLRNKQGHHRNISGYYSTQTRKGELVS